MLTGHKLWLISVLWGASLQTLQATGKGTPEQVFIGGECIMKYRVHRFDMRMTKDGDDLERFLNGLEGEVVSIVPNVTLKAFWVHSVNFLLIVEKMP